MTNGMAKLDVMKELIDGAVRGKIVKIVYRTMTEAATRGLLTRNIQPIRWEMGKFESIQLLAWDLDRHGWRKYAIDNIICITVTDENWHREMEHQIHDLPFGVCLESKLVC
jgi:predicted DNA-binding transcriptional regulator YafY